MWYSFQFLPMRCLMWEYFPAAGSGPWRLGDDLIFLQQAAEVGLLHLSMTLPSANRLIQLHLEVAQRASILANATYAFSRSRRRR